MYINKKELKFSHYYPNHSVPQENHTYNSKFETLSIQILFQIKAHRRTVREHTISM